jgi:hypothetical protein
MTIKTQRPNRRPKLHLPLFLCQPAAKAARRRTDPFPLTAEQLRRTVAEMID